MSSLRNVNYHNSLRLASGRIITNIYILDENVRFSEIVLINERTGTKKTITVNDILYKYVFVRNECLFLIQSYLAYPYQYVLYTYMPDDINLRASQLEDCLEIFLSR